MDNLKIVYRTVQSLVPYANNARVHTESQVGLIANSITEFGFVNPVLIADDGTVVAGHGRVLAAQRIGMKKVPCVVLSHLSERQRKALVIADNKIALRSSWDMEKLSAELGDLAGDGLDLELTGFDEGELDAILRADIIIPEFTVSTSVEEQVKAPAPVEQPRQEAQNPVADVKPLPIADFEDQGISYKRQYGVTVICENEDQQSEIFDRLSAEGLNCRIVVT